MKILKGVLNGLWICERVLWMDIRDSDIIRKLKAHRVMSLCFTFLPSDMARSMWTPEHVSSQNRCSLFTLFALVWTSVVTVRQEVEQRDGVDEDSPPHSTHVALTLAKVSLRG